MSAQEWFALPFDPESGRGFKRIVGASIRAWKPGDGLSCSLSRHQRLVTCGPPVAVVRTVTHEANQYRVTEPVSKLRNVCTRHVAESVRALVGDAGWTNQNSNAEVEKIARERVITAHWDEFQAALEEERAAIQERYLAVLPDSLRQYFAAVQDDEVNS
jgi:hypothetical protein